MESITDYVYLAKRDTDTLLVMESSFRRLYGNGSKQHSAVAEELRRRGVKVPQVSVDSPRRALTKGAP